MNSSTQNFDIDALRRDVLIKVLRICALFSTILFLLVVAKEFQKGNFRFVFLYSLAYSTFVLMALNRRVSHVARTYALVAILLGIGFSEFLHFGNSK